MRMLIRLLLTMMMSILCAAFAYYYQPHLTPRKIYGANVVYSALLAPHNAIYGGPSRCLGSKTQLGMCSTMSRIYGNTRQNEDLLLDDFDQILDAIYIHKKAFGDLNIPIKFDVPAEDPWPPHLHGLRLGKRLEKILNTQEFFSDHPDKVEEMKKLGFDPNPGKLIDDWDTIVQAMIVYKEKFGNLRVPSKFIVPGDDSWPRLSRNVKLGVRIAAIRSAGRYVKDHPDRKAELDNMGFEWRLRDTKKSEASKAANTDDLFESVYQALSIYQRGNGRVDVPPDFEVSADDPDYPEELHGLPLGSHVQGLKEKNNLIFGRTDREERLAQLGFVWEETGRALFSKKRFEMVYEGLKTYKALRGDLLVPQAFVVPETAEWPEECWNLKLGARVNAIRSQGTLVANSPERRELLDKLGFEWELPSTIKRREKTRLLEASGTVSTPRTQGLIDDVPRGQRGPKPTPYNLDADGSSESRTNLKLKGSDNYLEGDVFFNSRDSFPISGPDGSSALDAYGEEGETSLAEMLPDEYSQLQMSIQRGSLTFDPSRMFEPLSHREISSEAMRLFMQEREYSEDPDVRQYAHFEGHLTPESYHHVTKRKIPEEDIKMMKKTGYKMLEFGRFNWDIFKDALTAYHVEHGNVDVPYDYTITYEQCIEEDNEYTPSMVGLWLGEYVQAIRIGDIDGLEETKRRKFLDSLGFDWGEKAKHLRFRFVPMLLGLRIFRHLYGFAYPTEDWVVPDATQWPYWMAGMPLGEWACIARIQQGVLRENYPDRYDMLTTLGMPWFVPPSWSDGSQPFKKYYKAPR